MDLSVDSRLEMVETWATRKDSYWARAEDMESKDRRERKPEMREGESVSDPRGTMRGYGRWQARLSVCHSCPCSIVGTPASKPYRV